MSLNYVKEYSFLGGRIPPEIESLSKNLKDVDQEMFRKILKALVNAMEGKDCREVMRSIAESSPILEEKLSHVVAGMHRLLKESTLIPLSSLKPEAFKDDLLELRIPEDFITDFASVVFGNRRSSLEEIACQHDPHLPCILDFKWRVDVTISTSSLARALQPSILMQMKLSDGSFQRYEFYGELLFSPSQILNEGQLVMVLYGKVGQAWTLKTAWIVVSVSKFQELRYNVALILKEMNDLEKRSILKIQD